VFRPLDWAFYQQLVSKNKLEMHLWGVGSREQACTGVPRPAGMLGIQMHLDTWRRMDESALAIHCALEPSGHHAVGGAARAPNDLPALVSGWLPP